LPGGERGGSAVERDFIAVGAASAIAAKMPSTI
jgi:hypothetical protein